MHTHCTSQQLLFQPAGRRKVVADFDAGRVSSDGGLLLLSELEARVGVVNRFRPSLARRNAGRASAAQDAVVMSSRTASVRVSSRSVTL